MLISKSLNSICAM